MLLRFRAAAPVLLMVTAWALLVIFTIVAAKLREGGETLAIDPTPVPAREVTTAPPGALLFTVNVPARFPSALGVNVTFMEHDPPAISVAPQLLD
jgi:hypothetical protein